ncbi:MAG: SRPBCC family protein [Burkholderiales bacterium]|nr:SRPBCC family protein [Burkholderiales bacterium]
MSDNNEELGVLSRANGRLHGRLERFIEHDQEAVWRMLTSPELLAQWLAPGTIELRQGGAAKLNFTDSGTVIDSSVTAIEAPRLIEYSWSSPGEPARPVRWEAQPAAGGTRLTLTVSVPENEDIARACAGWEAHLMMLLAAIEGVPMKFPFERFKSTREAYKAKLAALS